MKKFGIKKLITLVFSVFLVLSLISTAFASQVDRNQAAFEQFKDLVANQYIFRDYKQVNWTNLYARYENQILNSSTDDQFAQNLGRLVGEVNDGHFVVYDTRGNPTVISTTPTPPKTNYNLDAIPRIIPNLKSVNTRVSTAVVQNVGYLMIKSWLDDQNQYFRILPELLQTEFLHTDALIIDVRMNGGGNYLGFSDFEPSVGNTDNIGFVHYFSGFSPTEMKIIGYWESVVGATLNDKRVIPLRQRGIPANYGIPYTKPVIVLIGESSASSCETFVAYMMHLANVATMGDTSMGASGGNNRSHDLVNGISMRLPMMALLDINQNYIEDVGISPNIQVSFINDGSDNVLIEAFRQLGVTVTDPGSNMAFNLAAKLDETGTVMTFTRSYLMNGVPFEHYGSPLASEHRNLMGSDWLMKIRFRKAGTAVAYRELVSESPIIVAPTYEQATFRLGSALEEGLYEIASYESGDDNDGVDLVLKTPGDWDDWYDNFVENSGLTESELKTIEDRFALFEDGNPQMSNTVLIEKEQSNNGGGTPTITTTSLPGGMVGTAYSQTLIANGTGPITWTLDSGNLPNDLKLNPDTGEISGIPTTAGTFNFTVKATNTEGNDTKPLSITIASNGGNSDDSSGGGGCNAGLGLFGLLPLAVWVARKRMAA
jgi:hypothetical protein